MVKSGLEFVILKFNEPLWSGQFSLSGQIFLHWEAATLKGLAEFQNPFSVKNVDFKIRDFTPLIKLVLGGLVY